MNSVPDILAKLERIIYPGIIEKAKKYLKGDTKAPAGVKVYTGKRGGRYYLTEDVHAARGTKPKKRLPAFKKNENGEISHKTKDGEHGPGTYHILHADGKAELHFSDKEGNSRHIATGDGDTPLDQIKSLKRMVAGFKEKMEENPVELERAVKLKPDPEKIPTYKEDPFSYEVRSNHRTQEEAQASSAEFANDGYKSEVVTNDKAFPGQGRFEVYTWRGGKVPAPRPGPLSRTAAALGDVPKKQAKPKVEKESLPKFKNIRSGYLKDRRGITVDASPYGHTYSPEGKGTFVISHEYERDSYNTEDLKRVRTLLRFQQSGGNMIDVKTWEPSVDETEVARHVKTLSRAPAKSLDTPSPEKYTLPTGFDETTTGTGKSRSWEYRTDKGRYGAGVYRIYQGDADEHGFHHMQMNWMGDDGFEHLNVDSSHKTDTPEKTLQRWAETTIPGEVAHSEVWHAKPTGKSMFDPWGGKYDWSKKKHLNHIREFVFNSKSVNDNFTTPEQKQEIRQAIDDAEKTYRRSKTFTSYQKNLLKLRESAKGENFDKDNPSVRYRTLNTLSQMSEDRYTKPYVPRQYEVKGPGEEAPKESPKQAPLSIEEFDKQLAAYKEAHEKLDQEREVVRSDPKSRKGVGFSPEALGKLLDIDNRRKDLKMPELPPVDYSDDYLSSAPVDSMSFADMNKEMDEISQHAETRKKHPSNRDSVGVAFDLLTEKEKSRHHDLYLASRKDPALQESTQAAAKKRVAEKHAKRKAEREAKEQNTNGISPVARTAAALGDVPKKKSNPFHHTESTITSLKGVGKTEGVKRALQNYPEDDVVGAVHTLARGGYQKDEISDGVETILKRGHINPESKWEALHGRTIGDQPGWEQEYQEWFSKQPAKKTPEPTTSDFGLKGDGRHNPEQRKIAAGLGETTKQKAKETVSEFGVDTRSMTKETRSKRSRQDTFSQARIGG